MQPLLGFTTAADESYQIVSFWAYMLNRWTLVHYSHNMMEAVVTDSFIVSAVGGIHLEYAKRNLRVGG